MAAFYVAALYRSAVKAGSSVTATVWRTGCSGLDGYGEASGHDA
jgi:hypothetical protein